MTCTKVYIEHYSKSKFPLPLPIADSSLFATANHKNIDVLGQHRTYNTYVNSVDWLLLHCDYYSSSKYLTFNKTDPTEFF